MFYGLCLKNYKSRISWIDIARCFSILIILYAHVYDKSIVSDYVHLFHVPVFFILSGLVWKQATDRKKFAAGLLYGLVIPYLFAGIVSIVIYQVLGHLITGDTLNLLNCVKGLFYANSRTGLMAWNRPLWFIPCLFSVRIIWELIARIPKNYMQYIVVCIIWALAIIIVHTELSDLKLPWELEVALNALPYYTIGVVLNRYLKLRGETKLSKLILALSVAALFAFTVLICNWNDAALSFQYNHYGNYLLFFLGAAAGSAIIFCISMLIEKCKAFEFIGQNTLIILLWHKFPILLFQSTGFGKSMVKNADSITSIIVGIVLVLISALLSLLVGFIFQKFFALFTMRKERN